MTIKERLKDNLFLIIIVLGYLATFIINPNLGIQSIKNSGYYLKEMLLIMPVIFVLTALLDLWVPKEKIIEYLGPDAKAKGIFFSFAIGSVSAGPIYAAFPMCVMLLNKGASIRNIIIILSAWSVVKIPMLINEIKFLGFKFMAIRWVLTVLGIIIFSWIADKIIKPSDLPSRETDSSGLDINENTCMGCSLCARDYPEVFKMEGRKAVIIEDNLDLIDKDKLKKVITDCPVKAISCKDSENE